jgi:hypothetical protein
MATALILELRSSPLSANPLGMVLLAMVESEVQRSFAQAIDEVDHESYPNNLELDPRNPGGWSSFISYSALLVSITVAKGIDR